MLEFLVTDLIKLAKKSLKMFDEYIKENNIKPPKRAFIRHFTNMLEISEKRSHAQSSSEIIEKEDWALIIFEFMNKKIKTIPDLTQLVQFIAKKYKQNIIELSKGGSPIGQTTFWIETFIQRLIYEKLEGNFSDNLLIEYSSLFKSELELAHKDFNLICHLNGIYIEKEKIKINHNVLIRKLIKPDLEYTRDLYLDFPRAQTIIIPSCILEIAISVKNQLIIYNILNRILNSLRLYRLGSIYSVKTITIRKTIIWPWGSHESYGNRNYSAFKKYTVKESEVDMFIKFINTISQKLNFDKEEKKSKSLYISIERYNLALLESIDVERKLLMAVMGLESLFTFDKDRGENSYKLGIRVAKLLGYIGFNVENVRNITEQAYSYRNKVVHGSFISKEIKKKIYEIMPNILNYLRVSLILFILKSQKIGKAKIIDMIEKSTISEIYNEKLRVILKNEIEEFKEVLTE
ncbi:MAG: hypothetical protein ACTSQP_24160 [Promethearchaeota archaeon]